MPRFSIRHPYFIVVVCLVLAVFGVTGLARMPVDLFPAMNPPEVVVATLIMLAIPMGFVGVLGILPLTHTTLDAMAGWEC